MVIAAGTPTPFHGREKKKNAPKQGGKQKRKRGGKIPRTNMTQRGPRCQKGENPERLRGGKKNGPRVGKGRDERRYGVERGYFSRRYSGPQMSKKRKRKAQGGESLK